MQKKSGFLCLCYILRAISAGRCRERRYADHVFIQIYFRMHHFVVKFSKFSSPQAAMGHWPPNQNPADVPAAARLYLRHFQISSDSPTAGRVHGSIYLCTLGFPYSVFLAVSCLAISCSAFSASPQVSSTTNLYGLGRCDKCQLLSHKSWTQPAGVIPVLLAVRG